MLAAFRHSEGMRIRGWGWVLPALIIVGGGGAGCSASNERYTADGEWEDPHGGQTGSLRPCSTPAFAPDLPTTSVPTGDAAVVFHTGCTAGAQFKLTDANGEPVPFELEALDDGVVLLQTDEALTPGTYQVETPDGAQKTVTVTDPAPIPSRLGSLSEVSAGCRSLFSLTFDPTVAPYLPLMRLEYAVDGGARQVWFEYGTIALTDGAAWLELFGVANGVHELEVFGIIAGEDAGPDAAVLSFSSFECASDEGDGGTLSCSLANGGTGAAHPAGAGVLLLLGGGLALGRRRRLSLTRRR